MPAKLREVGGGGEMEDVRGAEIRFERERERGNQEKKEHEQKKKRKREKGNWRPPVAICRHRIENQ